MEASKRIFVNTIAQYVKALINTCLSLYTVRLILSALGQMDYGIYSLVAGIIAMLGFGINAMTITTQRHLSYYQGKKDDESLKRVFSNSVILHLLIGILIAIVLLTVRDYLCLHFLNIPDERRLVASQVYVMTIGMLMLSFLSTPFKAALIAHENIVYISIIEVIDGVLKLLLAITILDIETDKLLIYTLILMCIYVFELIAYTVFCIRNYEECSILKIFHYYDITTIRNIGTFATWTTYGMGAVVLRTQGLSVLINKIFGPILNASYGIAFQVYGAVSFISTSITNAINPVLMKSEGQNNREKMLTLAEKESKFIVAMMALLFIPLIVEMDGILYAWLKEVPPYASFFCRCLLICFIVDQSTYGLNSANQAMGNIRNYTLLMYTPKILFLPLAFFLMTNGQGLETVMSFFIAIEAIVAIARLPFLHHIAGLSISDFVRNVFLRLIPLIVLLTFISLAISLADINCRFIVNIITTGLIGSVIVWTIVLTKEERKQITIIISKNKNV